MGHQYCICIAFLEESTAQKCALEVCWMETTWSFLPLTRDESMQVLSANGVSKVTAEVGQQMDPNLHEAMFDVPNPAAEPGSIAIIVKVCAAPQSFSSLCT